MCVNKNGNFLETVKNTQVYLARLIVELNLSIDDVFRHYDCSGKLCPAHFIDDKKWQEFKRGVIKYMYKNYIQILNEKTSNPKGWIELINYIEGNPDKLGDMQILKHLKTLIEKVGN